MIAFIEFIIQHLNFGTLFIIAFASFLATYGTTIYGAIASSPIFGDFTLILICIFSALCMKLVAKGGK